VREPRLVFGEVADLYERVRPSYPPALVDDVISLAGLGAWSSNGAARALEVGAGTAKATILFAQRGVTVHALEPSPAMASIARRKCSPYPSVTIEESGFEQWQRAAPPFDLVFSAQAWHWVKPEMRYRRAREALRDRGLLAVFWSRPCWERCSLREELRAAYARTAPDFGPDPGPMHPGSEIAPSRWEDWDAEIASADGLEQPEVRFYAWSCDYAAARYMELLGSAQDHILLADDTRRALLSAVGEVIERHGGTLAMHYVTKLCLARATDTAPTAGA
jgi:SAM-dependent methyltransferase